MLRKIAVNDALISVAQGARVYLIKEMTADTPVGDIAGAEFAVWEPDAKPTKEKAVPAVKTEKREKYDKDKIRELFLAGKKPKEIAAELGYPGNTVAYYCHKVEREG